MFSGQTTEFCACSSHPVTCVCVGCWLTACLCSVNNGCILPKTLATVLPPPYSKILLREVTGPVATEQEDLIGRHVLS